MEPRSVNPIDDNRFVGYRRKLIEDIRSRGIDDLETLQLFDMVPRHIFLPEGVLEGLVARSAIASTFAASLELAREGKIKLRQSEPFGPIYLKPADNIVETESANK